MLAGPGLGASLAAYQIAMLFGPVSTTLQRDFGLSTATIGVAVVAHLFAAAAGSALGFLLGRRVPTSIAVPGLALMLVGVVATTLAPSPIVFMLAGAFTGLGGGAVLGTAVGLAVQAGDKRNQALLGVGIAVAAGFVGGVAFGWLVTTMLAWRWAYLLSVPVILVALAGTAVAGIVAATRPAR